MVARASCAVDTPPSTEFSIAIIAASERPSTTSASASPTLRTGRHSWPRASGTWASAASVKVPAGPEIAVRAAGGNGCLGRGDLGSHACQPSPASGRLGCSRARASQLRIGRRCGGSASTANPAVCRHADRPIHGGRMCVNAVRARPRGRADWDA